jgi:hypothetical protein
VALQVMRGMCCGQGVERGVKKYFETPNL